LTTFADASVVVDTGISHDFWTIWNERLFSNMASNAVFTPPLIAIAMAWPARAFVWRRFWEALALGMISTLLVVVIFHFQPAAGEPITLFLLLPLLLWAAVRFGAAGVSTTVLFIALVTVWETNRGHGPFVREIRNLQIFFLILVTPLFCLGAVVEEQRRAKSRLLSNRHLSDLISDIASDFVNIHWDLINDEINRSLRRLQTFLKADVVSIFELMSADHLFIQYSARSERAGLPPLSIDLNESPETSISLKQGRPAYLTKGSAISGERALLESFGTNEILVVPVIVDRSLRGILVIASRPKNDEYPQDALALLRVYGEVIFDAIQRKHTMRTLAESEHRFRQIADSTPMLVWMSDPDGMYTYVNTSWTTFTGMPAEQHEIAEWLRCVHPDDLEKVSAKIEQARARRSPFQLEYRLRRHDGEFRWILDRGVPRFASDGSFLGFVGSGFDVSDLKRAEELLSHFTGKLILAQETERRRIARELHDDIGQRIAVLAIELETLQANKGHVGQMASKLYSDTKEIAASLRAISHNLHSTGLEVLPIGTALKALCKDFSFGQPSIRTTFSEGGVPTTLSHDAKLCVYRVAQEALQNISKHSGASQVRMELTARGDRLDLTISDNGHGFDVGERADLGLGLSSMRERLKALGGLMIIRSAPGKGTTIDASLPIKGEDSSSWVKAS
jgi:PAS domain S-box-containing protein